MGFSYLYLARSWRERSGREATRVRVVPRAPPSPGALRSPTSPRRAGEVYSLRIAAFPVIAHELGEPPGDPT
jgi:hypothetical protein